MKVLLSILVCTLLYVQGYSQQKDETYEGIQFDRKHSWQELLQKAKKENKLIYVDAYTTWCGPCKMLATEVHPKKEVGDFYNASFISFKAQIDTGKNDDEYVKSRYQDFKDIAEKYSIHVFPTHLFINGDGEIVHKSEGSMPAENFIELGKDALNPDKQFRTLKKGYEAGERNASLLYNLTKAASQVHDEKLTEKTLNDYISLQGDLFTEKNIKLIYDVTNNPDGKGFALIKNNPQKFDAVLGEGSAKKKLKTIVMYNVIFPRILRDNKVPDFDSIRLNIKNILDAAYADEFTQYAKVIYYLSAKKYKELEKTLSAYIKKYGIKDFDAGMLNNIAWVIFENVNDKPTLQKALQWALQSVEKESRGYNNDTVANLYFKLGNKAKAIEYGQKALALARQQGEDVEEYEKTLKKFQGEK